MHRNAEDRAGDIGARLGILRPLATLGLVSVLAVVLTPGSATAASAGGTPLATWTTGTTVTVTAAAGRLGWLRRTRAGAASVEILENGAPVTVPIARPREVKTLRLYPGPDGQAKLNYVRCVVKVCEVDVADLNGAHERRVATGSTGIVYGSRLLAPAGRRLAVSQIGSRAPARILRRRPPGDDWAFNGTAIASSDGGMTGSTEMADHYSFDLDLTTVAGKSRWLMSVDDFVEGGAGGISFWTVGMTTANAYAAEIVVYDQPEGSAKLWEVALTGGRRRVASLPFGGAETDTDSPDKYQVSAPAGDSVGVSHCLYDIHDKAPCRLDLWKLKWRTLAR